MDAVSHKRHSANQASTNAQNETRENTMFTNNKEMKATVGAQAHCVNPARSMTVLLLPLALLFAPSTALADNECTPVGVDPSINPGPDSYVCDSVIGTYTGGVTYDSDGDLTVESTVDNNEFGGNGIVLTGNGADNINFVADGVEIESRDMTGALLNMTAVDGNIDILTEAVDADAHNADNVTHGIRAVTTGSGNILITTTGLLDAAGSTAADSIGIEASAAGDGNITIDTAGSVQGNQYGILATATGANTLTINTAGSVGGGLVGLHATTDTGDIIITSEDGGFGGVVEGDVGLHAESTTGDIIFNKNDIISLQDVGVGISTDTAGETTIIDSSGYSAPSFVHDDQVVLQAFGGGHVSYTIANDTLEPEGLQDYITLGSFGSFSTAAAGLDFSGAGSSELVIGSTALWIVPQTQIFSDGDDVVSVAAGGHWFDGGGDRSINPPELDVNTTVDFGPGDDQVTNAGTLAVGVVNARASNFESAADVFDKGAGFFSFENLEQFDNAGSIYLGHPLLTLTPAITQTDTWNDDILAFPDGTTFTGSGDSRIFFDVNFNGVGQSACDPSLRAANGDLPVADCMSLPGGTTAGTTQVVIATDMIPGDLGAYAPDGIVLIDVSGGISTAEHFVLSPDSAAYDPELRVIDKRLFLYTLGYDAENQQHKLYSLPSQGTMQLPLLAHAAQSLWRDTSATWFQRQLDLRSALEQDTDLGGGYWGRISSKSGERDLVQSVTGGTTTLNFDNSYQQDNLVVNVGSDFLAGRDGNRTWVFGGTVAYGSADVEFDTTPNKANLEGMGLGLYGSYLASNFFVDAAVTGNWMQLDFDVPAYVLFPEGTVLSTDVQSLGARAEAGWRLRMAGIDVEPLAGLSYVRTSFDDIEIPADDPQSTGGASASYDDPISLRGSLGVRLGVDNVLPGFVPTDLSLTARAVEEFDGDSEVAIANLGPDAPVTNTFDGTFVEVSGGVTVSNASGSAKGYLNVDTMFESDYESLGLSAGFRYQW